MKRWLIIALILLALGGAGYYKREPLMMGAADLRTPKTPLGDHIKLIEGGVVILLPEAGTPPFPVVMQFHGCAGLRREFHDLWAAVGLEAGYAVMLVDSTGPRGISNDEALATVCPGKALLGQERAGDILAAVKLAEMDARLDTDHLIVAGWSHGAWTLMDYFTMDMGARWPAGIVHEETTAPQIDGAILFYPHCGLGALSRSREWRQTPPVLALIGGADTIVDADQCIAYFDARKKSGYPVDLVVYRQADHIFDDPTLAEKYPQFYNQDAARDAAARYRAFLIKARNGAGSAPSP